MKYKFSEVTINFDKKRVPLSAMERGKRKGCYRYFGAQGVIDYINDYIFDGKYLLIAEDGENLKSNKQNIAQIVKGKFWVNNHAHIIQTNEKCNIDYLQYYLNYTDISGYITGSAQPKLSQANLNNIELILPDIETQEKIVSILLDIDDKIELNNSINKNLEQQMDLLYTNMFIYDTNFVELGSVIETTSGGTPSRKNLNFYKNGTINWIKSKELLGTYIIKTEEHITDEAVKKSSAKILPKQSVLVAMYGATVGAYGIISKEMTCNQAICALIQNEKYPYPYIFETIKFAKNKLVNMAVGSAQQNISQILIKQLPVHSNLDKIKTYCNIAELLLCKILNIQEENERLTQLRATLLPKLMNGEIDVDKVEV